jgi:hypothetical protein
MYRSWVEQERLHAMFTQLDSNHAAPTAELLKAAESASMEANIHLTQAFENMVRKCYPGIIGPIIPINPERALEQPDFSLFFKPSRVPKGYQWLDGMELQAKVLTRNGFDEVYFRNSYEYRRQKEMVIVIPMSRNIPVSIFKPIFFSEIDRIGNIFQNKS